MGNDQWFMEELNVKCISIPTTTTTRTTPHSEGECMRSPAIPPGVPITSRSISNPPITTHRCRFLLSGREQLLHVVIDKEYPKRVLVRVANGQEQTLASTTDSYEISSWYKLRIGITGTTLQFSSTIRSSSMRVILQPPKERRAFSPAVTTDVTGTIFQSTRPKM